MSLSVTEWCFSLCLELNRMLFAPGGREDSLGGDSGAAQLAGAELRAVFQCREVFSSLFFLIFGLSESQIRSRRITSNRIIYIIIYIHIHIYIYIYVTDIYVYNIIHIHIVDC